MTDATETARRALQQEINAELSVRETLELQHGEVFDTSEMREAFTVTGLAAHFVVVTRKSDGAKGTLVFQHRPRFYFGFEPS